MQPVNDLRVSWFFYAQCASKEARFCADFKKVHTSLLRQEVPKDFFPKISFFAKFATKKQFFCKKNVPFCIQQFCTFLKSSQNCALFGTLKEIFLQFI
jgi:hypothetical protein